jgi:hypothetical protein
MDTQVVQRARIRREARVAAIGGGLFVVVLVLWLVATRSSPQLLERDWLSFDRAASRVFDDGWADAYRLSASEQLPFLYPPFALWLTLPLALLGPYPSYLVVLAGAIGCTVASGMVLSRFVPGRASAHAALTAATLLSGPFLLVMITGQNAAAYLLSIVGGGWLRWSGRRRAGGAAWAFLVVKPNLAAVFLVYLACRRDRRALEGFGATALAAMVATLPMGVVAWRGFLDGFDVVDRMLVDLGNWYGQSTVLAAAKVASHALGAGWVSSVLWLAVCVPAGLAVCATWRRASSLSALEELRLVSVACLFAVAANPRLYCYDALILAVPAAAWYLRADGDAHGRPSRGRRLERGCIVVTSLATFATFAGLPLAPLAGVSSLVWLVTELVELRASARRHIDRRSEVHAGT